MIPSPDVLDKLVYADNDIWYTKDQSLLPEEVTLNEHVFLRFCDFILIPDITENLSQIQVETVNNIRAIYFETHPQFHINESVRQIFLEVILNSKVAIALEFGPGKNPLITSVISSITQLFFADFNQDVVTSLSEKGLTIELFGYDSVLTLVDNSIDIVFSIFVFQFNISDNQINEIYRVLKKDGIFLFNIYNRNASSRKKLLDKLTAAGFHYKIIPDRKKLCKEHQYWLLYKEIEDERIEALEFILNT